MTDLTGRLGALALAVPLALGTLSAPAVAASSDGAGGADGADGAGGSGGGRVVRIDDPRITESSGLVVEGGYLVTTNDSGDVGRVFTLDAGTGETVGVTDWSPDAVDVEALAPAGDGHVWVGDTGDNGAGRPFVTLTRVPVGPGDRTVHEPSYRLVYPGRRSHDAETLLSDPATGRVYVATKEILGGTLYAVPEDLDAGRANRLTRVGPVVTTATDGAFLPDGRGVVIRGYFDATLYAWPSLRALGSFAMPHQRQGEGLAVRPDGTLLLSSEGPRSWVLSAEVPAALLARLDPPASPSASPTSSPTSPPTASGARPAQGRSDLLVGVGGGAVVASLLVGAALVVLRRRRRSS